MHANSGSIGALLYRPGSDLLCCLSKALKVMQNVSISFLTTIKAHTVEAEPVQVHHQ